MPGQKQFDPTEALDKAIQVFWRYGYHLTSVDDLTRAMGLGRGSLYGTFGNKDDLFLACFRRYVSAIMAENNAALTSRPDDHRAAIAAFYTAVIDRFERPENPPGCLGANTAHEWNDLDPNVQSSVAEIVRAQSRVVEEVLSEAKRRRQIPTDTDVATLTSYILGMSQTLAMMHRSGTDIATIRSVAEIALTAIPARRA
ncbi:TetR/AcrR family transcriptional regulator [soil metagenome]